MVKNTIKPVKAGGFLDFNTPEYLAREKMFETIEKVFRSFGYNPIETPMVEFSRVLTGDDDTSKNIFQVRGRGSAAEDSLALRFDHTVPLARFISANPYDNKNKTGIRLPWRRMAVGPVFRNDSPQKGRYRQFYQFDVDIAGSALMLADAEIISVIYETLQALGLQRFVIKINNRKVLNGLTSLLGIKDRVQVSALDTTKEVMRILDKIPKISLAEAFDELALAPENDFDSRPGLDAAAIEKLRQYLQISGDNLEKISQARTLFQDVSIAIEGLDELVQIMQYLSQSDLPESAVEIDFSIARGLDYYTGPVFESFLLDAPEFGSVFSGGRYNDLVARFTGQELPAVGASIGVDRLFAALQQLDILSLSETTVSQMLILRLADSQDTFYLRLADMLRQAGFRAELSLLEDTTFRSQFSFAVNQGTHFVIIAGLEEINRQVVQVKNLLTRQQEEISVSQLISYLSNIKNS